MAGAAAVVLLVLARASLPARAQATTLDELLDRTAAYVDRFERELSAIVAEETYVQRVLSAATDGALNGPARQAIEQRTLKSDLLLVRPADAGGSPSGWVQFRDVFEVEGRPVRDRAERLTRLFLAEAGDSSNQISRIIRESARYNIGDVQRTINVPILPLIVLEAGNQRRFRFRRVDDPGRPATQRRDLPDSPHFAVATEVWVVSYEETARPTLIQRATGGGGDIPSRGRFWIEPDTGRVFMSELVSESLEVRAQINVSYQSEPLLELLVPVEMRERYNMRGRAGRIEGTATYGRFRRFQVATNEEIAAPKDGPPAPR
jgi:hypothetical protein